MSDRSTMVSKEAIGVNILCPCLQLLVVYNILVCLVELVDDVACIPLQSIPHFDPIISIVVARQLLGIVHPSLLGPMLDVAGVDIVGCSIPLECSS